ncbi:MAG: tetratricopeptide repeat protein [Planctomycetota bacterium]|jgi:non-specific serine/threonine protein kinase/serine/threonine-protein kinase
MTTDTDWYKSDALLLERLRETTGATADGASPQQPDRPPPERIGRYRVDGVIASGGMGTIYEATQDHPHRTVAVKVMKHGIASRSAMRRFEYESQVLACLRHPGIAQVYEAGTHRDPAAPGVDVPFFAMEYIPAAKSITCYAAEARLTVRQRLALFAEVCEAVHHGHQKGVIHRDLKPGNILVDAEGRPKVIDFGVARGTDSDIAVTTLQTHMSQLIGTLQYMSPEQCVGDTNDLDTRSDVYALGVVLYELLSEKLPYDVTDRPILECTRVIREQQPTRLSTVSAALKGDIETIVLKALEKDRERRYQSAADLAQDIRRFLAGEAITARPPSMIYQLRVFARRNKAVVGAVAVVFVVLIVASIVSTLLYLEADASHADAVAAQTAERRQREIAEANAQLAIEREQQALEARDAEAEQRELAETNATRAEQIATLLTDMLGSVGPGVAMGRDTTLLREILDRTAEQLDTELEGQPEVEAELRDTVGWTYYDLGENQSAERMFRRALALRRSVHDGDHPALLESLNALSHLLVHVGRGSEAEPLLRELIATERRLPGDEDVEAHLAVFNLGRVLHAQGRLDEAEALYRQAAGDGDAGTLMGLASLLEDKGEPIQAEEAYRSALKSWRQQGPDTWELACAMNELASFLLDKGEFTEAEMLYRESHDIVQRVLPPGHPTRMSTMYNFGRVLHAKGRLDEAETLLRQAVGERDPGVLLSLANLLEDKGEAVQAEEVYRSALKGWRQEGPDTWELAGAMGNLASFLLNKGEFAEAETLYREARDIVQRVLPPGHPTRMSTIANLAWHYTHTDRPEMARTVWDEHLTLCRKELGENDAGLLTEIVQAGWFHFITARYDHAGPLLREALEKREQTLGVVHRDTFAALEALVLTLHAQGRINEARSRGADLLDRYQRLVESPEATAKTREDYAWLLLTIEPEDLRDAEAALPVAARAVELSQRKNASMLDTLAVAYDMNGDLDMAVKTQHEALALLPAGWSGMREMVQGRLLQCLEKKGDRYTGEKVCRESVAQCRERKPWDRNGLAIALIQQGINLVDHGKYAEAEPILRECLELRRDALYPGHWLTANAMSNLGESIAGQGRFAEAEPLLLDAYEQMQKKALTINYRVRHVRQREALDRIIALYESWAADEPGHGYGDAAAEWRTRTTGFEPPEFP